MGNIFDSLYAVILGASEGIAQSDEITLLTIAVALLALLVSLRSMRLSGRGKVEDESSELLKSGLQGKIARLERSLNDLRTETLREIALLKGAKEEGLSAKSEEDETADLDSDESVEGSTESKEESLSLRLQKTRSGFLDKLKGLFSKKATLSEESIEELEGILIGSDLGVKTSTKLLEDLKAKISDKTEINEGEFKSFLKDELVGILKSNVDAINEIKASRIDGRPQVVLLVGVNGVGKTTSAAKLGASLKSQGARVLLVAADTFRAAAVEQLVEWGSRVDIPVLCGKPDARPQTVVFDAMQRAADEGFDVVIVDTAGRLHTKSNLMQELEGISNIIKRFNNNGPDETILVLDGATGQNALQQAKEFHEAVPLSGIIITKLDGTPKGGIVVAIKDELGIPIRYIGVGESQNDLRVFNPEEFAEAILNADIGEKPQKVSAHANTRRKKRRKEKDDLTEECELNKPVP
ncbi:MAG: signal recognition particle-docking protein FtsY [SAR324 cluster bacterium]|uniref:Signal recognition particle receptor FtsY n=1 Tax=SAR324 cluster bacterium TaxID=2024889 RepID=A0A7X9IKC3_9DELT|nr:signal recognition particle-docking protein FtsY [SAR324 cluster bacterium]